MLAGRRTRKAGLAGLAGSLASGGVLHPHVPAAGLLPVADTGTGWVVHLLAGIVAGVGLGLVVDRATNPLVSGIMSVTRRSGSLASVGTWVVRRGALPVIGAAVGLAAGLGLGLAAWAAGLAGEPSRAGPLRVLAAPVAFGLVAGLVYGALLERR